MGLSEVRDIMAMSLLAGGAYIAYKWWTSQSGVIDNSGFETPFNTYVPSPDSTYSDHEFHGTVLDPVYDAGWNFMGWIRGMMN
jgi:hypothetical protein